MKKWVLKRKNIWFHIIVGYLTAGIWVIIYFTCKYLDNKKTKENIELESKEKNLTNNIDNEYKIFTCKLNNPNKYDCHQLVNTLYHQGLLDDNDLYGGMNNKQIKDYENKIYENPNYFFPCEISEENNKFVIKYTENYQNLIFGYIPDDLYNKVYNILSASENISGGFTYTGGYYKIFNIEKNKIDKGYDEIDITLEIKYK